LSNARADARLTDTLVALADPTRRAIILRLTRGEAKVTEIHIRMLERARLVRRRRSGREHFLSLDLAPLDDAARWIEATRSFWSGRLDALDAMLQAESRMPATGPQRKGKKR
jgi:hypothetical protein